MADNASGFVDFEAFRGLNQDSEDRLMQEAIARAEAADETARGSLRKVSREAEGGYGPGGSFRDPQADLTKVGSYSDYLKAKQNAAQAWAAVSQSTGDVRTDALRGGRGAQAAEMGKASASALGADFTKRAGEATTRWEGAQKYRAEVKSRDDKAKADVEARRKADDEKKRAQLASLGDPTRWQQSPPGLTPQDIQARMQQWLRLNADVGDVSPWSQQGKTARQLAWAPDPGIKDQGNPFAGESRWRPEEGMGSPDEMEQARIRGGGNYLNQWDRAMGYGDTNKWKG